MKYRIYIQSNNNPRTINTPHNGRTYYDIVEAEGASKMISKINELIENGEVISEVRDENSFKVDWFNYIINNTFAIKTKNDIKVVHTGNDFRNEINTLVENNIDIIETIHNGRPVVWSWMI